MRGKLVIAELKTSMAETQQKLTDVAEFAEEFNAKVDKAEDVIHEVQNQREGFYAKRLELRKDPGMPC